MPRRKRKSPLRHLVWIIPLLALDFLLFRSLALGRGGCAHPRATTDAPPAAATQPADATLAATPEPPPPPPPVWQFFHTPTPQQDLLHPDAPGVLQPTASGRLISARFGSTRRGQRAGRLFWTFHEGVDIAPVSRDRKGEPEDDIFAVADGRVALVNTTAGNSSYGKYIVIEHPDPSLGVIRRRDGSEIPATVYTLYGHLAAIRFGLDAGDRVQAGDPIGTMGHTSNTTPPIPASRAHLHWEIGLLLNGRFDRRARELKQVPNFGNHNGQNLFGFDPLDVYAAHMNDPAFTFGSYIANLPPACTVLLRGRLPDFFSLYPALWHGAPHNGGPIHLTLSESGCPLSGRNATPAETEKIGNARHAVLSVNPDVLGNNGRAYIRQTSGKWKFTDKGKQWAEILFY